MRKMIVTMTCALALMAADNAFVGTWERNAAKSKPDPSAEKIQKQTLTYSMNGGVLTAVVMVDGKQTTSPTMYDGQEHDATSTGALGYTQSIATAKGNTLETVFKRDGKIVGTRKGTLSSDGRTMTTTNSGTKPDGGKYHSVVVFDKQ